MNEHRCMTNKPCSKKNQLISDKSSAVCCIKTRLLFWSWFTCTKQNSFTMKEIYFAHVTTAYSIHSGQLSCWEHRHNIQWSLSLSFSHSAALPGICSVKMCLEKDYFFSVVHFSALTLLDGWQEGHQACKKKLSGGCWCGYLSGVRCRFAYGPADATATHCLFSSVKSRLVLLFWYRLTQVVPDKGPLNRCCCCPFTVK